MSEPLANQDRSWVEWAAVAVVSAIGLGLRLWPIGRLGLNQFDEGIYALVSTWSMQPKGLAAIDPVLISYAPPGYPILGGLAYWLLGRSDGAMIAVSQLAGTLTIPVVAWLGRRSFGPGAGFAAATLCAFSGAHIATSRMALTDASFLLAWLVALGMGMRFLDRPGLGRAVAMGLAVGMAQQFKYNGWLAGGIVIGSAMIGIVLHPEERNLAKALKTFGWGALAVGIAWLVVWPWYAFVENHGGYSALLRHQQSYLGGFRNWWPNLLSQADQAMALSGGDRLILPGLLLTCATPWLASNRNSVERRREWTRPGPLVVVIAFGVSPWLLIPAPYWLGLMLLPWLLAWGGPSGRVLGIWWLGLSAMTPFYHPYSRLWLPYHAVNWLLMAALVTHGPGLSRSVRGWVGGSRSRRRWATVALWSSLGLFGLGAVVSSARHSSARVATVPGLLAPGDSLYRATVQVAALLPDNVQGLRVLVRPPVSYYLAGRVALYPMAGSESLGGAGNPRVWALVDSAILRSEASSEVSVGTGRNLLDRFANDWEVVEEFPTNPTLPTLLDLDPALAWSEKLDRTYPLWLLRPRTAKARP